MTSDRDLLPAPGRAVAGVAKVRRTEQRWSRRRGVTGAFAAFAAVVCAGAYVAPLGATVADANAAEVEVETVSLYAETVGDTQTYVAASADASAAAFDRSSMTYSVYVKPKPTPTPTVEASTASSGSSSSAAVSPKYTGGGSKTEWLTAAGIAEGDWSYVDYIATRESGWNPNATNPSSGACGLIQAYPCSKVPGNGYNPVDNLRWANGYAVGRYGSWAAAYDFWTANHWW